MNFIRKIFEGKTDDLVHKQFVRYGKGSYENKALLDITVSKTNYKIKTSFEYSGEFAVLLAEELTGSTRVTGGIISTKNLSAELGSLVVSMKQADMNKEQILDLFKRFPTNLILLSFKSDKGELKSKVKAPKAAKVGKDGDEGPKADFCVLTTADKTIVEDLLFDIKGETKKVFINHTFVINSLTVPKEYENNVELARYHAIRKGTLIRKITIDGKEEVKEKSFEA